MEAPGAQRKSIILVGGGGHAKVVLDALLARGDAVAGFVDDSAHCALSGTLTHLGAIGTADTDETLVIAIGDVGVRRTVIGRLMDARFAPAVVHLNAMVCSSPGLDAALGAGVFVGPGAIVNAGARVGDHAIINSGAIVEHDCRIGINTHIGPGAVLGGSVRVGIDSLVGLGARVLPGVRIGSGCVIGAGAVVIADVGDGETVVGVPARGVGGEAMGTSE